VIIVTKKTEMVDKIFIFMILIKEMLKDLLNTEEFKELIREILMDEEEPLNSDPGIDEEILTYFS